MRNRVLQVGLLAGIVALLVVAVVGMLATGSTPKDRAYELEQRLRCPVCQSVSIADSPSETAQTMRVAVAEQVAAGRSDEQIIDYFRARYGDWVLLDPPATGPTLLVWLLPLAGAVIGTAALLTMRARRRQEPDADLTAEQRDRLARALDEARATSHGEDLP